MNSLVKRTPVILCLVGPAGSGKTSNMLKLREEFGDSLKNSVTVTTRALRPDDLQAKNRESVSEAEFKDLIAKNLLFEFEEIHGKFYGTRKSIIENAFIQGYDLVFDIDIRGALSLKKAFPENTVNVFMAPLSSQVLIERIKSRSATSEAEIKLRLATAEKEYSSFLQNTSAFNYFIINDKQDVTYQSLASIFRAERLKLNRLSSTEVNKICQLE